MTQVVSAGTKSNPFGNIHGTVSCRSQNNLKQRIGRTQEVGPITQTTLIWAAIVLQQQVPDWPFFLKFFISQTVPLRDTALQYSLRLVLSFPRSDAVPRIHSSHLAIDDYVIHRFRTVNSK